MYLVYLATLSAAQSLQVKISVTSEKELERTCGVQSFPNMSFCAEMFL
jgi:hypothetical protein